MCCTVGLSFFLEVGQKLVFVPPQIDCPRSARIVSIDHVQGMQAQVRFDTFENAEQTARMVGAHCLIQEDDLSWDVKKRAGIQYDDFTVIDDSFGELGSVVQIIDNPGQSLLVVDGSKHQYGEILIPVVDAFIVDVDELSKIISVSIPENLLEL